MRAALQDLKQDWQVWTIWYDDRLNGYPRSDERELAYVRIGEDLWGQGSAVVNAEIRRRIQELEPPPLSQIPLLRPAALEPFWYDRILVLPSGLAEADGDADGLSDALNVLRAELTELADDVGAEPGNFDKRAAVYLRRYAERIRPQTLRQLELFRLAHSKEFLEAYAKTVDEAWPNHLAARFHALTLHFDRVVRQFPGWRAFVRNAEKDRLTVEQVVEVPALANAIILALREDEAHELIDPAIPSALDALKAPFQEEIERWEQALDPIEMGKLLIAEDIVESVNNILKRIAEAALRMKKFGSQYGKSWKEGFAKQALSSAGKDGGKAYIWMKRTLIGITTGDASASDTISIWLAENSFASPGSLIPPTIRWDRTVRRMYAAGKRASSDPRRKNA